MPDIESSFSRIASVLFATSCCAASMTAQCDLEWRTAGSYPGANGVVYAATSWDPDGPGPASELLVLGGEFTIVGDAVASRIATYDDANGHCTPLGGGIGGAVRSLLALPNGGLIAGGAFATAGGAPAANVARFDGTAWNALGSGIGGTVRAVVRLPNGDVVAGGLFAAAGGAPAANVARWDGVAWSTLGSGTNGIVCALAVAANGDLIAGGDFTTAGGQPAARIARWSNGAWQPLGAGCDAEVRGVAVLPNGDVFAAGTFSQAGGTNVPHVARWNGTAWSAAASIHSSQFGQSLTVLPSGDLVLGMQTQGTTSFYPSAARWTGAGWEALVTVSAGNAVPVAIHAVGRAANGTLVVGGDFRVSYPFFTDRNTLNLVRVVGTQAVTLGRIDAPVVALAENGATVVAAGETVADAGFSQRIDAWTAPTWTPVAGMNGPIRALGSRIDGRVLAAGAFSRTVTFPSTATTYHFAALVGSGATMYSGPFGQPFPGTLGAATFAGPGNTNLVAHPVLGGCGGNVDALQPAFHPSLGNYLGSIGAVAVLSGCIEALASPDPETVLTSGTLYGGGTFAALGNCAQHTGSQWTSLGGGVDATVRTLLVRSNGELIAGGDFTNAGGAPASHVARWNGTVWSPLGGGIDGPVHACAELPGGDLIVGGAFTTAGSVAAANLARWNGSAWSAVAGGTNGRVRALLLTADGTLWVGGEFTAAGAMGCGYVARLVPPCPATVASIGTGCAGSGGLDVLTATSLPWQGTTFTSQATGMPALAFVLQVNGLSPINVPLGAILPQGVAGCVLLTTPDLLDVYLPAGGVADFHLTLPATSVLIGQTIYQQAAPLELDAGFGIVALTSSNLLQLTVGGL